MMEGGKGMFSLKFTVEPKYRRDDKEENEGRRLECNGEGGIST